MRNKRELYKTRWLRWLGAKCREDRFVWTDLLDSNLAAWPRRVLGSDGTGEEDLKSFWTKAIKAATNEQLQKLDVINLDYNASKK